MKKNPIAHKVASEKSVAHKGVNADLAVPTNLAATATRDISAALNALLADIFALYLKTKNFHWHMSGPHFRDYHLLLDEQADQIFAMTDVLAERVREAHGMIESGQDVATSSLLEVFIDETERRHWFLYEASHRAS